MRKHWTRSPRCWARWMGRASASQRLRKRYAGTRRRRRRVSASAQTERLSIFATFNGVTLDLAGAATWEVGIARSSVYRTLHKHGRLNSMAQSLAKLWHRALILVAHGRQPPNCRPPRTRGDQQGCDQPRTFERPGTKLSDAIWSLRPRIRRNGRVSLECHASGALSRCSLPSPRPHLRPRSAYGARRSTEAVVARIAAALG
jgi:hypothetical protein